LQYLKILTLIYKDTDAKPSPIKYPYKTTIYKRANLTKDDEFEKNVRLASAIYTYFISSLLDFVKKKPEG